MMRSLANMMIGMMKVSYWGMLQTVKDTNDIIRGCIKWLIVLT
jgi:hypothetical protein